MSNAKAHNTKIKLKGHEFPIPPDEPYRNDLLGLKPFGDTMKTLVKGVDGALVLSINGSWGTGKTTFLKMWEQSLKNDGLTTIYFSAWEDDYCDDPLISLVGQIRHALKEGDWKEMGNTLKEIIKPSVAKIAFAALSQLTAGAVDLNDHNLKSCFENAVDEYIKSGSVLKDVKARLKKQSEECLQNNGNPLVVIIDELDRCRPLFAIGLLEKIKHLFELPGIIFVLGVDRTQLGHSIKSVYGQEMDVDGYLRRFIDLEFLLPKGKPDVFMSEFFKKLGIASAMNAIKENDSIISSSFVIAKIFSFSLRDMEYLCRTWMLATLTGSNKFVSTGPLVPFLVAMKLRDESFYKDVIAGNLNAFKMIEHLVERYNFFQMFGQDTDLISHLVCSFYSISPQSWKREINKRVKYDQNNSKYFFQGTLHDFFPSSLMEYIKTKTHYVKVWDNNRNSHSSTSSESTFFYYINVICSDPSELPGIVKWIEFSKPPMTED